MTENKVDITNKEWINKLNSNNEDLIKKSLEELREKGNSDLIPDIAGIVKNNQNEEIKKAVISFFADLKDQKSVINYVQFLKENKNLEDFHLLISTCWENGLDFSEHLQFFADLIMTADYFTAIESFTVVEENIEKLNMEKRIGFSDYISKNSKAISKEKKALIDELLSIINPNSGPFSYEPPE